MPSSESLFSTLPEQLQHLIDNAFDMTVEPNRSSSTKAALDPELFGVGGGGGFLVEPAAVSGGRFLVEDDAPETEQKPTEIPFDFIPAALQCLDLPPDDDEILSVFKNAASGWTSSSIRAPQGVDAQETYVSRDDWRSVCAVLLENRPVEEERGDSQNSVHMDDDEEDEVSPSDEYMEDKSNSSQDLSSEASDDEYMEGQGQTSSRPRTRIPQQQSKRALSPAELSARSTQLSSRQRQACLNTFALFFPDVPSNELSNQKIMIKDLQRVAKLLGEKLKADEVVEMLEMFSSSPDKSMDLADFSRMMIAAKLA